MRLWGVDLEAWRLERGIMYSDLGRHLALDTNTAERIAIGARWPSDDVLRAIDELTDGEVDRFEMLLQRIAWRREHGGSARIATIEVPRMGAIDEPH